MMPTFRGLGSVAVVFGGSSWIVSGIRSSFPDWLPPRPEFDADEVDKAAKDDFVEAASATGDFGVAGHFGFEEEGRVFKFTHDEEAALLDAIDRLGRDWGDGGNFAMKIRVDMGTSFECDRLAAFVIGAFFLG